MLSGSFGVFKHLPGVILKRLRGYKQSVCNFRISCALHKVKQYLKIKLIEGYKHIFKLYKLCQIRAFIILGKVFTNLSCGSRRDFTVGNEMFFSGSGTCCVLSRGNIFVGSR